MCGAAATSRKHVFGHRHSFGVEDGLEWIHRVCEREAGATLARMPVAAMKILQAARFLQRGVFPSRSAASPRNDPTLFSILPIQSHPRASVTSTALPHYTARLLEPIALHERVSRVGHSGRWKKAELCKIRRNKWISSLLLPRLPRLSARSSRLGRCCLQIRREPHLDRPAWGRHEHIASGKDTSGVREGCAAFGKAA